MMPLILPSKPAKEDKTLKKLCEAPGWAAHHAVWQAAYDAYRTNTGDPWRLTSAVFSTNPAEVQKIAAEQRDFYKNRSRGGPLARIRKTPGLLCCPMCGSHHTGTLDHYLPRDSFPEFSILPCNLVPACSYCNSGVKQARYKGKATPERFIHPYFDKIAKDAIWHVEIVPPFLAAKFKPQVSANVAPDAQPLVQFHLDHILGYTFKDFISSQWSLLPKVIHGRASPNTPITEDFVFNELNNHLRDTEITSGINGWRTALLRGVVSDQEVITFITGRAATVGALVP